MGSNLTELLRTRTRPNFRSAYIKFFFGGIRVQYSLFDVELSVSAMSDLRCLLLPSIFFNVWCLPFASSKHRRSSLSTDELCDLPRALTSLQDLPDLPCTPWGLATSPQFHRPTLSSDNLARALKNLPRAPTIQIWETSGKLWFLFLFLGSDL